MKFASKQMDLEKTILSEVIQTQKNKYNMYLLTWLLDIKQRKTSLQFTTIENLDNKEDPKRSTKEGEKDKIS